MTDYDYNFDGITDEYILDVTVPLASSETATGFQLLLFFDYALKVRFILYYILCSLSKFISCSETINSDCIWANFRSFFHLCGCAAEIYPVRQSRRFESCWFRKHT